MIQVLEHLLKLFRRTIRPETVQVIPGLEKDMEIRKPEALIANVGRAGGIVVILVVHLVLWWKTG